MLKEIGFKLDRVVIDYPLHISSFNKFKNISKKMFEWRIGDRWVGTRKNISYDEFIEALKNNKFTKTPHLYLYKE